MTIQDYHVQPICLCELNVFYLRGQLWVMKATPKSIQFKLNIIILHCYLLTPVITSYTVASGSHSFPDHSLEALQTHHILTSGVTNNNSTEIIV